MGKVLGVGTTDISPKEDRKAYMRWFKILERCYSDSYQLTRPTYKGCSVAEEWWNFSSFRNWLYEFKWEHGCVDKDILVKDNKIYSPSRCLVVPIYINSLLTNCKKKGSLPLGVYFEKLNSKYRAQINKGCGQEKIGDFQTPLEAHLCWQEHKIEAIRKAIEKWKSDKDMDFSATGEQALLDRVKALEVNLNNKLEVISL